MLTQQPIIRLKRLERWLPACHRHGPRGNMRKPFFHSHHPCVGVNQILIRTRQNVHDLARGGIVRNRVIGQMTPGQEVPAIRDWSRLVSWPVAMMLVSILASPVKGANTPEDILLSTIALSVGWSAIAGIAAIIFTRINRRQSSIGVPFWNLPNDRSLGAVGCYTAALMVKSYGYDSSWPVALYVLTWMGLVIGGLALLHLPKEDDTAGRPRWLAGWIRSGQWILAGLFVLAALGNLLPSGNTPQTGQTAQDTGTERMTNAIPISATPRWDDLSPTPPQGATLVTSAPPRGATLVTTTPAPVEGPWQQYQRAAPTVRDVEVTLTNGAVRIYRDVPSDITVAQIKDRVWSDYKEIVTAWHESERRPLPEER